MEYLKLVELYEKVEATTKRLEKTHHIAEFLKKTSLGNLPMVALMVQGKIYPPWDEHKIGVASRLVMKAISKSTGITTENIEKSWKKTGDLGDTAVEMIKKKKQRTLFASEVTVKKVFNNLRKLAVTEGQGSVERKMQLISELLTSAKPKEAKYIVRNVLEDLRVGVGDGSVRDAIVWAFFRPEIKMKYDKEKNKVEFEDREVYNKYVHAVQEAYDMTADFSVVAPAAKEKGLKGLGALNLVVGKPVKVMLYPKAKDMEDAFETVGKPAQLEYKYDGFRMQVHKKNGKVVIFTRRLDNVTLQFPEIVKYVKDDVKADSFILDAESVGFDKKTGKYLAFQNISQRIRRKYDIEKMAKDYPVELNVFDVLYYNGKNVIKEPFEKRREIIEKIINPEKRRIVLAKKLVTSDLKKANEFYAEALQKGNEGIMMKKLDAIYKPGSRVGYGVKVKPVMESLDLVIVGAEWGTGKRAGWLTSLHLACIDEDGNFLTIGKVGTGMKEKESEGVTFQQITDLLKPIVISEKGKIVKVKPQIVIEINYEEIQKSPTYTSGYALRFPRLINVREDKPPEEASDLDMVEELYHSQKGKK
jgi:DNA ligase-1